MQRCWVKKHVTKWPEDNRLIKKTQAGFREGYGKIDLKKTSLLALIQNQLLTHRKLYAALIDRNRLWNVLENSLKGRMYRAIKGMCGATKSQGSGRCFCFKMQASSVDVSASDYDAYCQMAKVPLAFYVSENVDARFYQCLGIYYRTEQKPFRRLQNS